MQSYLQYRRVGRQVEQELEAKKNKKNSHDSSDREKDIEAQRQPNRRAIHSGMSSATRVASDNDLREKSKPEQDPTSNNNSANNPVHSGIAGEDYAPHDPSTSANMQHERAELERVPTAQAGTIPAQSSQVHDRSRPNPQTRVSTLRTFGTHMGVVLTGVNVRDRTTKEGGGGKGEGDEKKDDDQVFVVSWEGDDDDLNPHNWSSPRRWFVTVNVALIAAVVGIASSIDSSALMPASMEFHVSEVVESLATGLYLAGFGCGMLEQGIISGEGRC